jgi:hypothetical protein
MDWITYIFCGTLSLFVITVLYAFFLVACGVLQVSGLCD